VITYDEHGGFFDHVPPPAAPDDFTADGFGQLGFRVPSWLIGPYVKPGHVSSVQYDHTSLLAHIETMFDLEPLTARDAAANDFTDAIDLDRLAARDPLPPPTIPAVEVDESMLDAACFARLSPPTDIERLADTGFFPAKYDHRGRVHDTLRGVAQALDRHTRKRSRLGRK